MERRLWKERINRWWVVLIPFCAVLSLLRVSPEMYDGWAGPVYYQQFGGLLNWISYVFGPMRAWINGRVSANLLSGILESFPSEWPLDVVNALIIAGILASMLVLFDVKHRLSVSMLYTALFVLMPYRLRVYVVQIALLQYLAPVLFMLVTLILLRKYTEQGDKRCLWVLYPLGWVACTWMENTSLAFGAVLTLVCLIRTIRNRKADWLLWGVVAVSLAGGLFMVTSHGMVLARITIPGAEAFLAFSKTRLIKHLNDLVMTMICEGALANTMLALVLTALSVTVFVNRWRQKGSSLRLGLCVANLVMLALFFALGTQTNEFRYTAELNMEWLYFIKSRALYTLGISFVYLLWLLANILFLPSKDVWKKQPGKFFILFTLYGVILLGVMFPTNQIGSRINAPAYFNLICIGCFLLEQVLSACRPVSRGRKLCLVSVVVVGILALDFQSQLCMHLSSVQTSRLQKIEWIREKQAMGTDEETKIYTIAPFNERDACLGGIAAINSFHYPQFLNYYHLEKDTKIIFTDEEGLIALRFR